MDDLRPQPALLSALAQRRARYRQRGRAYRVMFTLAGGLVTLAGATMLITPGPAFVIIPAGLAMLSMEFRWAERPLAWALVKAAQAKAKAARTTTAQKLAVAALACAAVGGLVAWALLGDVPLLPV